MIKDDSSSLCSCVYVLNFIKNIKNLEQFNRINKHLERKLKKLLNTYFPKLVI